MADYNEHEVVRLLKDARDLLGENGENWLRYGIAEDKWGFATVFASERAVKFSAATALGAAIVRADINSCSPEAHEAHRRLQTAVLEKRTSVGGYNSQVAGFPDIDRLYKRAIKAKRGG